MNISQQKLDEFQARMSNWVSSQGLFFQLTHGGSVQGAQSTILGWLGRMILRFSVLAFLASLVSVLILVSRPGSAKFHAALTEKVSGALAADEVTVGPIKKKQGNVEVSSLDLVGSPESFYEKLKIRDLKTRMGLLSGVVGQWDGEVISIGELEGTIKSGSEDSSGGVIFDALFARNESYTFDRVEVFDVSLDWGYSEVTAGRIENSSLRAMRQEDGWSMTFTGGRFSQNWLQDLEIVKVECEMTSEGLNVTSAQFTRDGGELSFAAEVTGPISDPQITGSGTMKSLPFDAYLESEVQSFVGGQLSGDFTLGGSPYGPSGVTMSAEIVLGPDDEIVIRDEIRLLDAVSLVDRYRSYKKVGFRSGSFSFETGKRVAAFTDIKLEAKNHMSLEGEFISRPPSTREVDTAIYLEQHGEAPPENQAPGPANIPGADGDEVKEFDLADAVKEAREGTTDSLEKIQTIFESEVFGLEVRRRQEEARKRFRRVPHLVGVLRLGLHSKAFEAERSKKLSELYPINEQNNLRWLRVELDHALGKAGSEVAETILLHAKD